MRNINIGSNDSGMIGDVNIIVFSVQKPLTQEQVEEEFLKLNPGDLQDITSEVDAGLLEKRILIKSYVKNYWLQLKMQLVNDDFRESWLPLVAADMDGGEKKQQWQVTPVYQNVVFPFSYFFVTMDSSRYWVPLPKVEYNKNEKSEIDRNDPVKRCTITEVQYQLGKTLTDDPGYNTSYDNILKKCKIEVIG
jgi:hypothetical protein